jgi:hypothetical protein
MRVDETRRDKPTRGLNHFDVWTRRQVSADFHDNARPDKNIDGPADAMARPIKCDITIAEQKIG